MSLKATVWAWSQQPKTPTQKFVLVALADRHNGDTGRCDPHVERLAQDTGLGERAVRDALKVLTEDGFIGRERGRRADGSRTGYSYTFPHLQDPATPAAADAGRDDLAPRKQPLEPDAALEPRTDLSQEQTSEPGTPSPPARRGVRDLAVKVYDPLKGVKIDGRNLPFDALAEETQADVVAEGGKIATALVRIRELAVRDLGLSPTGTRAELCAVSPDACETLIATEIRNRARAYKAKWPDIDCTPGGIANNWSRVLLDTGQSVEHVYDVAEEAVRAARGQS